MLCCLNAMYWSRRRSVLQDLSALETSAQNAVCLTLWHGINWIRSILNFFAYEKKEYYAVKVAERLENLSLLESILLDEAVPACPSFRPPGGAATMSEVAPPSAKLAGDGKKKAGRPAGKKKLSGVEDRKLAIKQSFVPMKPEVVSILKSARLQPRGSVSMDPMSQDASSALEMPLIRILFSLLEHHVQRSCSDEKKRKFSAGFWSKGSGLSSVTSSEDILEHHSNVQSVRELLAGFRKSEVLDAAGRFAAHIVDAADQVQTRLASDAVDVFDRESLETQLKECTCVLVDYLKVVATVLSYGIDSGEASDSETGTEKIQQLQELILPVSDRVEYREKDPDVLQQVRSFTSQSLNGGDAAMMVTPAVCLPRLFTDHQEVLQGDHPIPPRRW